MIRGGSTGDERAINVLYAVPQGERGGVERFLETLFASHDPARARPVVLAAADGSWLGELASAGLPVYCLGGARIRHAARNYRTIGEILRGHRIDVIHSAYAWCHSLVAPAGLRHGCRLVWFHHGPIAARRFQGFQPLVPADLLLAASRFLLSRLRQSLHGARRTAVVHYGLQSEQFTPNAAARARRRVAWNVPDGTLAVGIIGFIDEWKGQDVFLQAARELRATGAPLRFFVVGGPRSGMVRERCQRFEARLHAFVSENQLGNVVSFTGHVDLRDGVLDALDVAVHASTEPEPFGMAVLEAMANGKAVIASAEGGPPEFVTHGIDGLLVPPRNSSALVAAIGRLAADADLRARLGVAARATVQQRFRPRAAAAALEQWYERLLGRPWSVEPSRTLADTLAAGGS